MAFVFFLSLRSNEYTLAVAATRSCAVETAHCIYSGVSLDCSVLPYPTFTARERKKYARLDNFAVRSIYQHVSACVRSVHAVSLPGYLCHAFASEGVNAKREKKSFQCGNSQPGPQYVSGETFVVKPSSHSTHKAVTSRKAAFRLLSQYL